MLDAACLVQVFPVFEIFYTTWLAIITRREDS